MGIGALQTIVLKLLDKGTYKYIGTFFLCFAFYIEVSVLDFYINTYLFKLRMCYLYVPRQHIFTFKHITLVFLAGRLMT